MINIVKHDVTKRFKLYKVVAPRPFINVNAEMINVLRIN